MLSRPLPAAVGHRRRGDHYRQQQPESVGSDVPFPSLDLLRRIDSLLGFPYVARRLDALSIQHRGARLGISAESLTHPRPQKIVDTSRGAVLLPLGVVVIDRATYKIALTISRRSWTGGLIPKPRRASRHCTRTGSINAHRASDRSVRYGSRPIPMLDQRTIKADGVRERELSP